MLVQNAVPFYTVSVHGFSLDGITWRYNLFPVVAHEKTELERRESIEHFSKDKLKRTSTVEKQSLPDAQGGKIRLLFTNITTRM